MHVCGGGVEGRDDCSRDDLSSSFICDNTYSTPEIATSGVVEMLRVSALLVYCIVLQFFTVHSFFPCGQGSWFKFDDDEVTPFNPREIETTCFGGVTVSASVRHPGIICVWSKLQLVYERVYPFACRLACLLTCLHVYAVHIPKYEIWLYDERYQCFPLRKCSHAKTLVYGLFELVPPFLPFVSEKLARHEHYGGA